MRQARAAVVMVSPSLPFPPTWGFGARVYHLARQIAREHPLHLLCCAAEDETNGVTAMREICSDITVVPIRRRSGSHRRAMQLRSTFSTFPAHCREAAYPALQRALYDIVTRFKPSVVQLESSQLCALNAGPNTAVVLDEHNIEYELLRRVSESDTSPLRRVFNRLDGAKLRPLERASWRSARACLVPSERDAAIVAEHAPATLTAVVPNGVDLEYFVPAELEEDPESVVFTGALHYRPNLDAARFLVSEVLPPLRRLRPEVAVTLVGYGAPADLERLRAPGVTVTGWVPDIRPYLARASVVVTPLRTGGGTRLKILDALAMRKAVVSTTLGCEGLLVRHGRHLVVADRSEHLALEIAGLLSDPWRRRRLGDAGRALVTDRYSWDRIGASVEEAYRRVESHQCETVEAATSTEAHKR